MKFPTIKQVVADERDIDRKERIEAEALAAAKAREFARRETELREEALKIEEDILRVGRRNVFNGLVSLAQMTEGIANLCRKVNAKFMKAVDGKPDELPCTLAEAFLMLQRWQSTGRGLIASADMLLQIERLRSNLPTTIVGFDTKNATIQDAERELAQATRAMERARKLELVVNNAAR